MSSKFLGKQKIFARICSPQSRDVAPVVTFKNVTPYDTIAPLINSTKYYGTSDNSQWRVELHNWFDLLPCRNGFERNKYMRNTREKIFNFAHSWKQVWVLRCSTFISAFDELSGEVVFTVQNILKLSQILKLTNKKSDFYVMVIDY